MKLKAKVLRYKKRTDVYGHMVFMDNTNTLHIWPSNIPDLFPTTASVDSIKNSAVNQGRLGTWEKDLENYEMVEAELEILN